MFAQLNTLLDSIRRPSTYSEASGSKNCVCYKCSCGQRDRDLQTIRGLEASLQTIRDHLNEYIHQEQKKIDMVKAANILPVPSNSQHARRRSTVHFYPSGGPGHVPNKSISSSMLPLMEEVEEAGEDAAVLVPAPDFYPVENSGPSSASDISENEELVESDSEGEKDMDKDDDDVESHVISPRRPDDDGEADRPYDEEDEEEAAAELAAAAAGEGGGEDLMSLSSPTSPSGRDKLPVQVFSRRGGHLGGGLNRQRSSSLELAQENDANTSQQILINGESPAAFSFPLRRARSNSADEQGRQKRANSDNDKDNAAETLEGGLAQLCLDAMDSHDMGDEASEADLSNDDHEDDDMSPDDDEDNPRRVPVALEDDEEEKAAKKAVGPLGPDEPSDRGSDSDDWTPNFPYEENLFELSVLYQFEKRMATSRDAIVYKAVNRATGTLVAIKLLDELARDLTDVRHHPKEVRILVAVQGHPHLPKMECWHSFPNTRCHAIVAELLSQDSTRKYLFGNPRKIRKYMWDMLQALSHIHAAQVVYRDLKPSNCLWNDKEDRAVIIDFDVATFFDAKNLHRSKVGTDGYMAPEMIALSKAKRTGKVLPYRGYDFAVDVFSGGVVLAQMIFEVVEEDVTDDDNLDAKWPAFTTRAKRDIARGQGTLAHDLILRMLDPNPFTRIKLKDVLQHEYFSHLQKPTIAAFNQNAQMHRRHSLSERVGRRVSEKRESEARVMLMQKKKKYKDFSTDNDSDSSGDDTVDTAESSSMSQASDNKLKAPAGRIPIRSSVLSALGEDDEIYGEQEDSLIQRDKLPRRGANIPEGGYATSENDDENEEEEETDGELDLATHIDVDEAESKKREEAKDDVETIALSL